MCGALTSQMETVSFDREIAEETLIDDPIYEDPPEDESKQATLPALPKARDAEPGYIPQEFASPQQTGLYAQPVEVLRDAATLPPIEIQIGSDYRDPGTRGHTHAHAHDLIHAHTHASSHACLFLEIN